MIVAIIVIANTVVQPYRPVRSSLPGSASLRGGDGELRLNSLNRPDRDGRTLASLDADLASSGMLKIEGGSESLLLPAKA